MHKLFRALAAALVLGASQYAGAAVINFDNPGLIGIDNATGGASYQEAGFTLTGEAAGFLTIDGLGRAATGTLVLFDGSTVSVMGNDGSPFSFSGLFAGALDAQNAATLRITGIFGDSSQLSTTLELTQLAGIPLPLWTGLTELRFLASGDLIIDDIVVDGTAVPEPASLAMLLLGMGALFGARRTTAVRKEA